MKSRLAIFAVVTLVIAGINLARQLTREDPALSRPVVPTKRLTKAEAHAEWMALIESLVENERLLLPAESDDPDIIRMRRVIEFAMGNAEATRVSNPGAPAWTQRAPEWGDWRSVSLWKQKSAFVIETEQRRDGWGTFFENHFDLQTGAYLGCTELHVDYQ